MEKAVVGIGRNPEIHAMDPAASQAAIKELASAVIAECADLGSLVRGNTVLLKPNYVRPSAHNPHGIVTDRRFLLAMAELVRDAGAREIWLGDNPGYGLPLSTALEQTGDVRAQLERLGVKIRFFDLEPTVELDNPDAVLFHKVTVPRCVLDADCYINLPKMKTHMHTLVTLGIKNQYGLILDDQRMTFHRNDINIKIVDILRVVKPHLTVIDGIVAVQGQAPISGSVVPDMDTITASKDDVVALDAVTASLMGIAPSEVAMLRLAHMEGLGCADLENIEVRGLDGLTPEQARRDFKRPVVSSLGAYPQIHGVEGGTCFGCLSALRHAMDKLHVEGRLTGKPTHTVYSGKPMPNMPNIRQVRGDLWCFGSCAADLVFSHHKVAPKARFIPGCPPHILDFYKAYIDAYCDDDGE